MPLPDDAQAVVARIRSLGIGVDPTTESPGPQAAAPQGAGDVRARAEAGIARVCEGGFDAAPDAFLTGNLDGDGIDDIAIKWDAITCLGSYPRPLCGASQCAVELVLSSHRFGEGDGTLYAAAADLVPLSNGNMGLKLAGTLATCRDIGRTTCDFIWYWSGNSLEPLAVE